jgi:hypothetical protein
MQMIQEFKEDAQLQNPINEKTIDRAGRNRLIGDP